MPTVALLETPDRALRPLAEAIAKAAPDFEVEIAADGNELARLLEDDASLAAVFVERFKGDGCLDGLEMITRLRALREGLPIVAVAPHGNVEIVAEAVDAGATSFLVLGDQLERRVGALLGKLRNVSALMERNRRLTIENRTMKERIGADERIIGRSPQMLALLAQVDRVAAVPRPVLITGERGTGKELIARLIHERAGDGDRPLVSVNCAAFAEGLLESELFGHERGSFTGAARTVQGKFEQASGGTLFLDEIGTMSLAFQQKILRAVEYGVIMRVGGSREIPIRTRIIAATNADLQRMMREGAFLRDLYDRLAFEVIHVPPLRERTGDIERLAQHFLDRFMQEIPAFRGKRLSRSAIQVLNRLPYPGNVRELKNIIERAAYRDTTQEITPSDLGLEAEGEMQQLEGGFVQRVEAFKSRLLNDALIEAGGNQAEAARRLGLTYHQFRYHCRSLEVKARKGRAKS